MMIMITNLHYLFVLRKDLMTFAALSLCITSRIRGKLMVHETCKLCTSCSNACYCKSLQLTTGNNYILKHTVIICHKIFHSVTKGTLRDDSKT